MSGIAGIIRFDNGPVEQSLIEKMTAAMSYRGPDGINHWVCGSVAVGQCMLRTTPESLEETQPLTNEDESLVLVMDGRVDNWEELRTKLLSRGAKLRTRADAELVLRAYEIWGRECLTRIHGDFALVIWNTLLQEAFCARDRIGNKPFNYYWNGSTLVFASEVHPILSVAGTPEKLNIGMVAEFLAAEWTSRDETFWQGILRLVAAHRMVVKRAGPRIEEYWTPDPCATLPYTKEEDFVEHYRDLLEEMVRRMSRTYAPLACEVSGGLDSSALFAVANDLLRQRRLPAPGLEGYTLKFDNDSQANELVYARAVAEHVGRPVHEVAPSRMPLDWYRECGNRYRDFPGFPNGVMGLGIRRTARDRGSRVLLGGAGGDQWLGGSRAYYAEALEAGRWGELFDSMKVDRREEGLFKILWWVFRQGAYPLLPDELRQIIRRILCVNSREGANTRAWLQPTLQKVLQQRIDRHNPLNLRPKRVGQRGLFLTLSSPYSAHARELEERAASRSAIELRSPFFCEEMVQFSFSTPERWRMRGRTDKNIHRAAMRELLPERVLQRHTKAEFTVTYSWYLSDLRIIFLERDSSRTSDWVKGSSISSLFREIGGINKGTPADFSTKLRSIWCLFACATLDKFVTRLPSDEEDSYNGSSVDWSCP